MFAPRMLSLPRCLHQGRYSVSMSAPKPLLLPRCLCSAVTSVNGLLLKWLTPTSFLLLHLLPYVSRPLPYNAEVTTPPSIFISLSLRRHETRDISFPLQRLPSCFHLFLPLPSGHILRVVTPMSMSPRLPLLPHTPKLRPKLQLSKSYLLFPLLLPRSAT